MFPYGVLIQLLSPLSAINIHRSPMLKSLTPELRAPKSRNKPTYGTSANGTLSKGISPILETPNSYPLRYRFAIFEDYLLRINNRRVNFREVGFHHHFCEFMFCRNLRWSTLSQSTTFTMRHIPYPPLSMVSAQHLDHSLPEQNLSASKVSVSPSRKDSQDFPSTSAVPTINRPPYNNMVSMRYHYFLRGF